MQVLCIDLIHFMYRLVFIQNVVFESMRLHLVLACLV